MIDNLLEPLRQNEVVIIQDFSENYSCLLLSEPQTLHWTTQQAMMYHVVAIFVENGALKEDHFVFISETLAHNAAFVEHCDKSIRKYYSEHSPTITNFIEINDGCSQQFKSIKAISSLAKRSYQISSLYFTTSHGKSKWSNGLVVKVLDSQSRGPVFKTTGWLHGRLSLSSYRGR